MDPSVKKCDDKILSKMNIDKKEGVFSKPFIWVSAKHTSPVSWW